MNLHQLATERTCEQYNNNSVTSVIPRLITQTRQQNTLFRSFIYSEVHVQFDDSLLVHFFKGKLTRFCIWGKKHFSGLHLASKIADMEFFFFSVWYREAAEINF